MATKEKDHDKNVTHPLQSVAWGKFRTETGVKVVRQNGYQLTIHKLPKTKYNIGYLPKGPLITKKHLSELTETAKEHNCIFIRLEPNVTKQIMPSEKVLTLPFRLKIPQKGFFTKYSFVLDLTPSEEELLKNMKEKTRYNIRLALRKGVIVREDNSAQAFKEYLRLTKETTKRQKFFAHDEAYHQKMWGNLYPSGIAHLFTASYQNKTLASWIVFLFNDVLYYPYGASSSEHREVMASNLMMWEVIKWGKKNGAKAFDMWGALAPNASPKDPQMGFHRFKEGYGGELREFSGTYDLVIHPLLYQLYLLSDKIRWQILKLKK